jgi:hypothetical protein
MTQPGWQVDWCTSTTSPNACNRRHHRAPSLTRKSDDPPVGAPRGRLSSVREPRGLEEGVPPQCSCGVGRSRPVPELLQEASAPPDSNLSAHRGNFRVLSEGVDAQEGRLGVYLDERPIVLGAAGRTGDCAISSGGDGSDSRASVVDVTGAGSGLAMVAPPSSPVGPRPMPTEANQSMSSTSTATAGPRPGRLDGAPPDPPTVTMPSSVPAMLI